MRARRWPRRFLIAAVAVTAAVGGGVWLLGRSSLPTLHGEVSVRGLAGPVRIVRDDNGVPHIYAASYADANFALGYVHAQDRLWQMEVHRRTGAGRLAEIFGTPLVKTDRFLRVLGVRRVAEANYAQLDGPTRRILDAYCAGVNAYRETRSGVLPVEWLLLGVKPEPWTPADSLSWIKMMAWEGAGNWTEELLRLRLARRLSPRQIAELLPVDLDVPAVRAALTLPPGTDRARLGAAATALLQGPQPEGAGSNNWVVAGRRTATGKPLLANDTHLGLTNPSLWYFVHLQFADEAGAVRNVVGATLPSLPTVILGHNERVAWGFTNTRPDTQDVFIERVDPADPARYLSPTGSLPFSVTRETIQVKGEAPVSIDVRRTRHGPVVSDALTTPDLAGADAVLALAWAALDPADLTMRAGAGMNLARNAREFRAALHDWHGPQENVVFADVEGNVGLVVPGRVPMRSPDNVHRGLAPAPGWRAVNDWTGFVPFARLPSAENPPAGILFTANNLVPGEGPGYPLTYDWQPPYRADRIQQLLGEPGRLTMDDMKRMQLDTYSPAADELRTLFLAATPPTAELRPVLDMLRRWDGQMRSDRPEPLVFAMWWREFTRQLYADELGEAFREAWDTRPLFIRHVLAGPGPAAEWCDDVTTPERETCGLLLSRSLRAALSALGGPSSERLGRLQWGTVHYANLEHRPFSKVAWLRWLFELRAPASGDGFTLNVARFEIRDQDAPFASAYGPTLRAIYDLADLNRSVFVNNSGQSGHRLSKYYGTMFDQWRHGQYVEIRFEAEPARGERLLLRPRAQ